MPRKRGISPIVAVLLLAVIAVSAALIFYLWSTLKIGELTRQTEYTTRKVIIEGVQVTGSTLTLYVRNIGNEIAVVSAGYLVSPGGTTIPLSFATYASSTEIWGGDTWYVDPKTGEVQLIGSGKIVYDTFTSSNTEIWDNNYVNYNNAWSRIYYDPDGLKILSQSSGGWAVRGLISNEKIVDSSSRPLVIEASLKKTVYNVPDYDAAASPFAACLYLSPKKNPDPYYATPWFAVKLYPRYAGTTRTEAQLVVKTNSYLSIEPIYTWYSNPNTEPYGTFIIVLNESSKVYYYFWAGAQSGSPTKYGYWTPPSFPTGNVYIYVTIDNKVTESSRKVHVKYLKIYKGTSVTIENVKPGWTVQITDLDWNILYETVADGPLVSISLLDYIIKHGMPLRGHIRVLAYNVTEYSSFNGIVIPPSEVRALSFGLPNDLQSGTYLVKVVLVTGEEAFTAVKI